jgi:hypothetical protein
LFSDVNIVSTGEVLDKVYVKVKSPEMFVAVDETTLDKAYSDTTVVAMVPKQLPFGMDEGKINDTL